MQRTARRRLRYGPRWSNPEGHPAAPRAIDHGIDILEVRPPICGIDRTRDVERHHVIDRQPLRRRSRAPRHRHHFVALCVQTGDCR